MPVHVTLPLQIELARLGVSTLNKPGFQLPDHTVLEPPCSLKWMDVQGSLELGAFSYAVSGYYQGCRIGRYCSFGENVQIGRHPHPMHWFSTSPLFYDHMDNVLGLPLPGGVDFNPQRDIRRQTPPVQGKLTHIGHDVWIGHGAFILPGVTIGTGAVIAAMSVVTKDVPPYAVVAGSPAQVKRLRFPEWRAKRLLESAWWEYAPWQLKGASTEDFPAFFALLKGLREQGSETWSPERINVKTLAGALPG